jgi:phosphoribosyl 1,2-cyclic phosphodiesterase
MHDAGMNIEDIDAILITHEHSDHIGGAGVLARKLNVPLCITTLTGRGMVLKEIILRGRNKTEIILGELGPKEIPAFFSDMRLGTIPEPRFFNANEPFVIGDINIQPFSISHDAVDPVGFLLEHEGIRVGICTDLGVVPHYIKEILHDAHVLFFESNHDVRMLEYGPYTPALKSRVRGNLGHLSNLDAATALLDIIGDRTEHILLSHLSENNNTTTKAYHTVRGTLREFHLFPELHLTKRDGISEIIRIE